MDEMIERVARALMMAAVTGDASAPPHREPNDWERKYARVAIEAMREPTDPMFDAAELDDGRGGDVDARLAGEVWRAMIDAALAGE